MQEAQGGRGDFTPEESWRTIHETVGRVQSSMYVAGTATILLLWGVIVSLGYLSQFAIASLAPGFAESNPWFPGPLWGTLATVGMVGSGIIGHRAGRQNMAGKAARNAGIRVFLFWLAVMGAAFLVPGAAGLWNAGDTGDSIARVAVAIVALGYILFGIMHRPAIVVIGAGIAASFYIPSYLAGGAAEVVSGGAMLAVALLGAAWIHNSRVP